MGSVLYVRRVVGRRSVELLEAAAAIQEHRRAEEVRERSTGLARRGQSLRKGPQSQQGPQVVQQVHAYHHREQLRFCCDVLLRTF